MKKRIKLLSVFLSAFIFAGSAAARLPSNEVSAAAGSISEAKNGVVYVQSTFSSGIFKVSRSTVMPGGYLYGCPYDDLGDETSSTVYAQASLIATGSGFAIGEEGKPVQYIVTNAHVVTDEYADYTLALTGLNANEPNKASEVRVYFSYGSNDFDRAQIVLCDPDKDVCVLKLSEPTTKRIPLVLCRREDNDIDTDEQFAALGYPGDADYYKDAGAITYNLDDISVSRGTISSATTDVKGRSVYDILISINHGNSGGPVVNSKGEVIGIATYGVGDRNYALAIDELITAIAQSGGRELYPYTLSTEVGPSVLTIILIIAAAVVAAAIVVVIVVLTLKKKKAQPAYATAAPAGARSPAVGRKAMNAVITGTQGYMIGRSFSVGDGVVIGRNPQQCSVVYPEGTKGISGVHCRISRSPSGTYEVTDLGSSCGTILGSGQKLVPNVPVLLTDGTYICLGSQNEIIQFNFQ